MSRIDEALKALERETAATPGATRPEAAPATSHVVTLEQYAGEGAPTESTPSHASRRAQRHHERARVRLTTQAADARGRIESNAKLVGRATSPVAVEQYRRLAATLHDAQVGRGLKTVMVTSAVPREGKTLTSVNLALTLSESYGRRVLLVDADLRRPSVHEVLGLRNTHGLSEALEQEASEFPFAEMSPNWSVLTAGHSRPQPLAGLTSERMGALLEEFESRFEWVLLDTPPVGFLPDAGLLAGLIRSVVLVIGAGSTPAPVVERAVAQLGTECILGVVLNRVEDDEIPEAGYYGDYYGSGGETPKPAPVR